MANQLIFDKDGESYTVEVLDNEAVILFNIYLSSSLVGGVRCIKESLDVLFLGDIAIANEVILNPRGILGKLLRSIGCQPKPINYRGRGLGSALLEFFINYARESGFKVLYGNIYRQDLQSNPKLMQWYKRYGFEVKRLPTEAKPDVVSRVELNLLYTANRNS